MDPSNRGVQQQPVSHPVHDSAGNSSVTSRQSNKHKNNNSSKGMWTRVGIVAAIVAVVVLLLGITVIAYENNNTTKDTESTYIKSDRLQAVFLNTGQVYFGNITSLNNNFLVLTNIFYLQTSSSSSSSSSSSAGTNVSLVKLGCELHMPYDQMVINRSGVTFWENLQPNGQVAQAVSRYQKQYPNGQQCADQSTSSGSTSTSVQNANSNAKP